MQGNETRSDSKVQALSWLVSQLRWEHMLGALRDGRRSDVLGDVLDHARRAA
ncbi:MAG TPA: hypothetical protein VIK54_12795 [Acidimicrobiia bacterium]